MIPAKLRNRAARLSQVKAGANPTKKSALLTSERWDELSPRIQAKIEQDRAAHRQSVTRSAFNLPLMAHAASKVKATQMWDLPDTAKVALAGDVHELCKKTAKMNSRDRAIQTVAYAAETLFKKAPESWVTVGQLKSWRAMGCTAAQQESPVLDALLTDGMAQIAHFDVHQAHLGKVAKTIKTQEDFDARCATLGITTERVDHRLARAYLAKLAEQAMKQAQEKKIAQDAGWKQNGSGNWMYDPEGQFASVPEDAWENTPPLVVAEDGGYNSYAENSEYPTGSISKEEIKEFLMMDSDEQPTEEEMDLGMLEMAKDLALDGYQGLAPKDELEAKQAQNMAVSDIKALGFEAQWEEDTQADVSWMEPEDLADWEKGDRIQWMCYVRGPDGEVHASLSGIDLGKDGHPDSNPYKGEVEKDLFPEAHAAWVAAGSKEASEEPKIAEAVAFDTIQASWVKKAQFNTVETATHFAMLEPNDGAIVASIYKKPDVGPGFSAIATEIFATEDAAKLKTAEILAKIGQEEDDEDDYEEDEDEDERLTDEESSAIEEMLLGDYEILQSNDSLNPVGTIVSISHWEGPVSPQIIQEEMNNLYARGDSSNPAVGNDIWNMYWLIDGLLNGKLKKLDGDVDLQLLEKAMY
jgi:hypothetical protein